MPEEKTTPPTAPEQPIEAPQPPKPAVSLFDPLRDARQGLTLADLPFTNEVDAALVRKPLFGIRMLSVAVAIFIFCLLVWASFADLDEVTRAEGQVVGSQRTQAIQNLEGGILRDILVREGQIVEKDTPLARLDNEMAESAFRDTMNKALENKAAIMRLTAELEGRSPDFPENFDSDIEKFASKRREDDLHARAIQILKDQSAIFKTRVQQRRAELEMLSSQSQQRQREVEEQIAHKSQLEASLALAIEQRNIAFPLMQRRNYSRVDYLALEQKVVQLKGDVEGLAASIPRTQAAAREAEQRIRLREAEMNTEITEEINKRRAELTSLLETLSAGGDRVTRTELRSPVKGTVKQIYLNTVGGVVKPGESIMDVVPLDDTLLVEARVRPADVAFLHPGQKAMIKVTAYDFSIYGGLEGALEQISADTIEDKKGEFFYLVKIRTPKTSIHYRGEDLPIIPGMMVTADILTGKKTVLDYLLNPILKARQNALRER